VGKIGMSQGQPRRPQAQGEALPDQPIRYGDVFDVSGELAGRPVAPMDAALLQSAEQAVLGQTKKGGPAAVLQSAAALNARAGHVGKGQVTGPTADAGATVTEAELAGRRVVSESVGGQVVARFVTPAAVVLADPPDALDQDAVTIGRALEAVAATAGDKPVDQSDAAAVQAAEMCATGASVTAPGGVSAAAQAAADHNARAARDEDKFKLRDVLSVRSTLLRPCLLIHTAAVSGDRADLGSRYRAGREGEAAGGQGGDGSGRREGRVR
jgi:hypothetical protein